MDFGFVWDGFSLVGRGLVWLEWGRVGKGLGWEGVGLGLVGMGLVGMGLPGMAGMGGVSVRGPEGHFELKLVKAIKMPPEHQLQPQFSNEKHIQIQTRRLRDEGREKAHCTCRMF